MLRTRLLFVLSLVLAGTTGGCAQRDCPPPSPGVAMPMNQRPPTPVADVVDAPPSAQTEDMTRASSTLDRFHAAAAAADEAAYFAFFAEGGVFLGTDAKERWTVPEFRAYAHPRFASGKAWSFRAARRALTVRGDIAWFDEDLDTPNLGPARGSGVLVRDKSGTGKEWKVAQYNLSIPIPNERFADVRKVIDAP